VSGRLLQRLGRQQRCKWKVVAKAKGDLVRKRIIAKAYVSGRREELFCKGRGRLQKKLVGRGFATRTVEGGRRGGGGFWAQKLEVLDLGCPTCLSQLVI